MLQERRRAFAVVSFIIRYLSFSVFSEGKRGPSFGCARVLTYY